MRELVFGGFKVRNEADYFFLQLSESVTEGRTSKRYTQFAGFFVLPVARLILFEVITVVLIAERNLCIIDLIKESSRKPYRVYVLDPDTPFQPSR